MLERLKRYAEAKANFESALAIFRETFGEEDKQTRDAAKHIAMAQVWLKDWDSVRQYASNSTKSAEFWQYEKRAEEIALLMRVGNLAYNAQDYKSARESFEKALALCDPQNDHRHATAHLQSSLATVAASLADYGAKRRYLELAHTNYVKAYGPKSQEVIHATASLADVTLKVGDLPSSRDYYERALELTSEALGPRDASNIQLHTGLASLLESLGDYPAAGAHYKKRCRFKRRRPAKITSIRHICFTRSVNFFPPRAKTPKRQLPGTCPGDPPEVAGNSQP